MFTRRDFDRYVKTLDEGSTSPEMLTGGWFYGFGLFGFWGKGRCEGLDERRKIFF